MIKSETAFWSGTPLVIKNETAFWSGTTLAIPSETVFGSSTPLVIKSETAFGPSTSLARTSGRALTKGHFRTWIVEHPSPKTLDCALRSCIGFNEEGNITLQLSYLRGRTPPKREGRVPALMHKSASKYVGQNCGIYANVFIHL